MYCFFDFYCLEYNFLCIFDKTETSLILSVLLTTGSTYFLQSLQS